MSDSSGNSRTWTPRSWAAATTRSIWVTLPSGSASFTGGQAAATRRKPKGAVMRLGIVPSGYTGAQSWP